MQQIDPPFPGAFRGPPTLMDPRRQTILAPSFRRALESLGSLRLHNVCRNKRTARALAALASDPHYQSAIASVRARHCAWAAQAPPACSVHGRSKMHRGAAETPCAIRHFGWPTASQARPVGSAARPKSGKRRFFPSKPRRIETRPRFNRSPAGKRGLRALHSPRRPNGQRPRLLKVRGRLPKGFRAAAVRPRRACGGPSRRGPAAYGRRGPRRNRRRTP